MHAAGPLSLSESAKILWGPLGLLKSSCPRDTVLPSGSGASPPAALPGPVLEGLCIYLCGCSQAPQRKATTHTHRRTRTHTHAHTHHIHAHTCIHTKHTHACINKHTHNVYSCRYICTVTCVHRHKKGGYETENRPCLRCWSCSPAPPLQLLSPWEAASFGHLYTHTHKTHTHTLPSDKRVELRLYLHCLIAL